MTENITDKSLLRCTYKKSLHVLERVVLYTAYIVDGLAALVIGIYAAIWAAGAVLPTGQWVVGIICNVGSGVASIVMGLVSLVPWYVWAIAVVVLAIPVYSLLWCVSRELTEEDYKWLPCTTMLAVLSGMMAVMFQALYLDGVIPMMQLDDIKFVGGCIIPCIIFIVGWFAAWAVSKLFYPIYHHYIVAPRKAKQEPHINEETQ